LIGQANGFQTAGEPVSCERFGNGHINLTYLVKDSKGRAYILQRINRNVFKDPDSLMGNILAVLNFMKKASKDPRNQMSLVPTKSGEMRLVDGDGERWRMYEFVVDSVCLESGTVDDFRESGVAFGRFQRVLAGFPIDSLVETIPHFHDTPARYRALNQAISSDPLGRAEHVREEIGFALSRRDFASTLLRLQERGELPLRVTHNDTKLNNALLDINTRKALCVIDLDTVMPGLSVNDFGDSIRFGASTSAEDEVDLSKVSLSIEMYHAFAQGFLSECGDALYPAEIARLRDGAKMMTLECGVRFLTDYLLGDTYFRTARPGHNLDRCRTQFKLVQEMEKQWDLMLEAAIG
jgi:Ser/Thr protein kinase RdoA (MazF antagonist)